MKTEQTAARGADGQSVIQLHERWTRILDRLTGAPIGHGPRISKTERAELVAAGKLLERQIAETRACSMAEVKLKLKMAACPILISGDWVRIVESAAQDLQAPDFETARTGTGGQPES